jgi:hypothetical protein
MREIDRVLTISENYIYHYINPIITISSKKEDKDLFILEIEKAQRRWYRLLDLKYGAGGRKRLAKSLSNLQYRTHRGLLVINGNPFMGTWKESLDSLRIS